MHHLEMERNCTREEELSTPPLREKVAFLSDARSYGGAVEKVEVRETHMSWVFLAGDYAFKLKKPVTLPLSRFLDAREAADGMPRGGGTQSAARS